MKEVVGIRFKKAGKMYYFDPAGLKLEREDGAIVETARGVEYGTVIKENTFVPEETIVAPLKQVIRKATQEDKQTVENNRKKEEEAFGICLEKIVRLELDMKLVDVEMTFDRNKLIFYFTSDGRVDFRELVKELAQIFRTRIELRQIGVRDESKMMGGIGVCGQPFCCSRFLSDFTPVSIKMAKEQGLSLNPAKISGSCGRLMCCLSYEQNVYEYLNSITPGVGSYVRTDDGTGTVTEVALLAGKVKVRLDRNKDGVPKEYSVDDISVIRRAGRANTDRTTDKELRELED